MLKQYFVVFFAVLLATLFMFSCTNKKNLVCFQGSLSSSEANKNYNPVLRTDDLLSIIVLGQDEVTSKPFNLNTGNLNFTNVSGSYSQGAPTPPGYLIDPDGNIEFPVIGKIKLAGLTRTEAIELLKEKLKPYLSDPAIIIRILNYKVTVLGEVKNPGTFTIPNERITLPEAIGIAGDLQITAIRKNIMVIRDVDGKKTEYKVDLTSKDLFNSPVYYLNQNDLVYIQPNRAKMNSAIINPSNAGVLISTLSLLVTVIVLLSR